MTTASETSVSWRESDAAPVDGLTASDPAREGRLRPSEARPTHGDFDGLRPKGAASDTVTSDGAASDTARAQAPVFEAAAATEAAPGDEPKPETTAAPVAGEASEGRRVGASVASGSLLSDVAAPEQIRQRSTGAEDSILTLGEDAVVEVPKLRAFDSPGDAAAAPPPQKGSAPPALTANETPPDRPQIAPAALIQTPGDAADFDDDDGPRFSDEEARAELGKRVQGRFFQHREVLAGKYRLERSIARGGMGWVFLATQLPLGREVAIKVMMPQPGDSSFRQRFLFEASTCAKLSHPNVVTIYDFGQTNDGDVFMVMEYLAGKSLARTLVSEKRLDPDRASRIVLQIARALRAAHHAGIVHRDLKPSNVMLLPETENGKAFDAVKVVDFGLAKLFKSADSVQLTKAGMMLGSPRYMAPEQIRNRGVDPRTDVYSLGILNYLMLTGRPPFDGDNSTDILTQHLRDPVPPMDLGNDPIVVELERIVRRCLEKRPQDRYQSIDDFLGDLKLTYGQNVDNSSIGPFDARAIGDLSLSQSGARLPFPGTPDTTGPHTGPLERTNTERRFAREVVEPPASQANQGWWAVAAVLVAVVIALGFWALMLE